MEVLNLYRNAEQEEIIRPIPAIEEEILKRIPAVEEEIIEQFRMLSWMVILLYLCIMRKLLKKK
jgi:hypothetical protein